MGAEKKIFPLKWLIVTSVNLHLVEKNDKYKGNNIYLGRIAS